MDSISRTEGMVIRQERHVHVAVADILHLKHGVDVGRDVVLRELYRLGHGSRSGSEEDDRRPFRVDRQVQIIGKSFLYRFLAVGHQLGYAAVSVQLFHADVVGYLRVVSGLQLLNDVQVGLVKDQNVSITSDQRTLHLVVGQTFVQRDADSQSAERREIGQHPFVSVFADDRDPLSAEAFAQHTRSQEVHVVPKIFELDVLVEYIFPLFVLEDKGVVSAISLCAVVDQFAKVLMKYGRKHGFKFFDLVQF